jgi:N-acetylmuramoyl-L-alanine amidase
MDKIYKIYLDAGHGLHTANKCSVDGSVIEWDLNNRVCNNIETDLAKYNCVVYRCDDPTGETDPAPTSKRLVAAEEGGADVCISIHHNISVVSPKEANGVEVFVGEKYTEDSKALAESILHNLVSYTSLKNRGLKTAELCMCKPRSFPTVLVEGGFISNPIEVVYVSSDEGIKAYANAVSSSLISFLGLTKDYSESALQHKHASSVYYLSTAWENLTNRKGPYPVLANAIADCDKLEGYKVYADDGCLIHTSELQKEESEMKYVKVSSKDGRKMSYGQTLKMRDKPNGKEGSVITEIPYNTKLILKSKTNSAYWMCSTLDGIYTGYLFNGYLVELK